MWKFWKNRTVNEDKEKGTRSRNIEEKIQRWLWEEGFEARKIWGDNSKFRYLVTKNRLPKFLVGQPKSKSDCLVVESGIGFGGVGKAILAKIFDRNQSLSWELRLHLASRGFFFRMQPPGQHSDKTGGIILAKLIYYDELSKSKFLDNVFQVLNITIFTILTLRRHLITSATKLTEERNSLPYLK